MLNKTEANLSICVQS